MSDYLVGRFTNWLSITLYRRRIKFLSKEKNHIQTFSLETLEIDIPIEDENFNIVEREYSTEKFVFQNKRLEVAFYNLSLKYQRVLEMIYVLEMTPGDVAAELDCRPQQIYDAHYQAIKKLRAALLK